MRPRGTAKWDTRDACRATGRYFTGTPQARMNTTPSGSVSARYFRRSDLKMCPGQKFMDGRNDSEHSHRSEREKLSHGRPLSSHMVDQVVGDDRHPHRLEVPRPRDEDVLGAPVQAEVGVLLQDADVRVAAPEQEVGDGQPPDPGPHDEDRGGRVEKRRVAGRPVGELPAREAPPCEGAPRDVPRDQEQVHGRRDRHQERDDGEQRDGKER